MKRANEIFGASGSILSLSLPSLAQTRTLPTQTITISGTVEIIDDERRAVNIKTADGKFEWNTDVTVSVQRQH